MSGFSLGFSGDWHDVWLYKDSIALWNSRNVMLTFSTEDVLKQIRRAHGLAAESVARFAIFRTDWKASAQFRALLNIQGAEAFLGDSMQHVPSHIDIDVDKLATEVPQGDAPDGIITDSSIYANRVYLATTEGMFESLVYPGEIRAGRDLAQVCDVSVFSVSAKYGAVNAAAHEGGLWFRQIRFGEDRVEFDGRKMHKIGEYALRVDPFWRDLMCYGDSPYPTLFHAKESKERPHAAAQFESWRVRGYSKAEPLQSVVEDLFRGLGSDDESQGQMIGNSDQFAVLSSGSKVYASRLSDRGRRLMDARKTWTVSDADSSGILATHAISNGVVLEEENRVLACFDWGTREIFFGEVGRVRTFKDSQYYKEVVAVVHNEGVSLVGAFPSNRTWHDDRRLEDVPSF